MTVYVGLFMYLQMETYTEYFPIQPFFEEPALELPKEEVEVKPENIEVPADFKAGDVKNISRDMNDTRKRSEKDWHENKSASQIEAEVKAYEKSLYTGDADRKAILKEMEDRKNAEKNKKAANDNKNPNPTQGGNTAAAGNVMVDWSLSNRNPHQNNNWYVRNPGYTCGYGSSGKVTVKIDVNQNGDVVNVVATGSSGANDCMIEQAKKYAKLSRFNYSSTAPKTQSGTIIYTFVGQ